MHATPLFPYGDHIVYVWVGQPLFNINNELHAGYLHYMWCARRR